MKVYKVKLKDANYYLEPVFNSREVAIRYSGKYSNRDIEVEEHTLNATTDYVYRIKYLDEEGYSLGEDLYDSIESAKEYSDNNIIVKEAILTGKSDKYELIEV